MRILVTAKFIGDGGGSGRYMQTLIDGLRDVGHDVVGSTQPDGNEKYDLIICSHKNQFQAIKNNSAQKIFVSHGLINDETFQLGADRYVSVSEEVRRFRLNTMGIDSEIIPQPIKIHKCKLSSDELRKILIIRSYEIKDDPFSFLKEKYDVKISNPNIEIEKQIDWADLCITLGRGALESFAQGKPVLVADNRSYIGAYGDGYVSWDNITQLAKCNFSGRRYRIPLSREWIKNELKRYDAADGVFLHKHVSVKHNVQKIVKIFLNEKKIKTVKTYDYKNAKLAYGVMVNNIQRLDMVLRESAIAPDIICHTIKMPDSATKGLNRLLDIMENEGVEIAVLTHQDMYYRQGWTDQVKDQLSLLPESWMVAGIIGKDMEGLMCGKFQDMRIPHHFNTSHIHEFPHPSCCFDECCIIVNVKSGFRFDETMDGFDLYGTLAVLQAWEMGGTAWIIDAFAEHYCMRPFSWVPDRRFRKNYKWLYERYENIGRIDSTAIGLPKEKVRAFQTSAA